MNKYTVRLNQFEGPLELLLELIENRKLEITEISLAEVADQFIEYLGTVKNTKPKLLADFIYIASRLLLIKSRAILPILQYDDENDEENFEDLKKQLEEYKRFRHYASLIKSRYNCQSESFSKCDHLIRPVLFYPPKDITVNSLREQFKKIAAELNIIDRIPQIKIKDIESIEEKMKKIQMILASKKEVNFNEISRSPEQDKVLNFLAILELIKQNLLNGRQEKKFGDIKLVKA